MRIRMGAQLCERGMGDGVVPLATTSTPDPVRRGITVMMGCIESLYYLYENMGEYFCNVLM